MTNPADHSQDEFHGTDEFHDVFASLVMLKLSLDMVLKEPAMWKWAILGAHSLLQGACVCFLTRTDGGGALSDESERKLREYHNLGTQKAIVEKCGGEWILGEPQPPKDHVATLIDLLKRLPGEWRVTVPKYFDDCKRDSERDLWRLHDFRNSFTHFQPVGWSIEKAGLPRIIGLALDLAEEIITDPGYTRYPDYPEGTRKAIRDCKLALQQLNSALTRN
ncbi:hypothetical protein [Actibacterium ureilyticum]|uniref:hypothetical protein n=1 Tax=Actibacterium ureilyticum TaxID=1590614 RepID=UPI0011410873|nr:hypothetical protein [Actibacterium ureilyticum]